MSMGRLISLCFGRAPSNHQAPTNEDISEPANLLLFCGTETYFRTLAHGAERTTQNLEVRGKPDVLAGSTVGERHR